MRVALHGFGSFSIVFWHMIQYAKQIQEPIEWAIVLSSDHHRELFTKLLGVDRVIVLDQCFKEQKHRASHPSVYRSYSAK